MHLESWLSLSQFSTTSVTADVRLYEVTIIGVLIMAFVLPHDIRSGVHGLLSTSYSIVYVPSAFAIAGIPLNEGVPVSV